MKPVTNLKVSSSAAFAFTAEQIDFALQNAQVKEVSDDLGMNTHTFLQGNQQNPIVSHSLPELRAKLAQKRAAIGRPKKVAPKKVSTTIR